MTLKIVEELGAELVSSSKQCYRLQFNRQGSTYLMDCLVNISDCDITRQLRSIILRTNILLRTFSRCSIEVKLHLFQSYCTNLYCSHLGHIYTKTQLIKLRITYSNALSRLFNLHPRCSASAMFAWSNMPSLDEIRRKYMYTGLYKDLIAQAIQSCCVSCHLQTC